MKKVYLLLLGMVFSVYVFAQIPEDALKFSWNGPTGTARVQAIGGAMGALGGDISANYNNPAGLALFKTNDLVITPGLSFLKSNSNFRGDLASDNKMSFNLGTSGAVFGFNTQSNKWISSAFSIAVSQTANFNNNIFYSGKNNFSSYGEQFAAEVAGSGLSLDDALNSSNLSYPARLAIYTFLVDTLRIPGNSSPDVVSMSQWNKLKNNGTFLVNQQNHIQTTGGVTEIALSFASNKQDKLYIGGSLGIPIVNYTKRSQLRETDISGDANNNFNFSELDETFTTKGVGLNVKLGMIYKLATQLRVGLAIHTPSFYALTDTYTGSMTTDVENYAPYSDKPSYQPHVTTADINAVTGGAATGGVYKYDLQNPWRIIASGAYVIGDGREDVKQQKGFITADVEYVNYKSNKYTTADQSGDNTYYNSINSVIKQYYKGCFNFKVGGELKFNTLMTRLGFSYYGNPYSDGNLKGNKTFISGGLGYRNKGKFIDVSYVAAINNDVNFPYRLSDKANTFATVKGNGGTLAVTVGLKF